MKPALLTQTALVVAFVAFAGKALAHEAPSGWEYDPYCCDERDCRQLNPDEVHEDGDYYVWASEKSGATHRIHRGSSNVRASGDGHFHGCELPARDGGMPSVTDYRFRCLYIPLMF